MLGRSATREQQHAGEQARGKERMDTQREREGHGIQGKIEGSFAEGRLREPVVHAFYRIKLSSAGYQTCFCQYPHPHVIEQAGRPCGRDEL
jgi:hypothetical protein